MRIKRERITIVKDLTGGLTVSFPETDPSGRVTYYVQEWQVDEFMLNLSPGQRSKVRSAWTSDVIAIYLDEFLVDALYESAENDYLYA